MKKEYLQDMSKIQGKIHLALKQNRVVFTDFLDPTLAVFCTNRIEQEGELRFFSVGGYDDAERKIFIVFPHFISREEIEIPLTLLRIKAKGKGKNFDHREVLGSVLGLGLNREKIGDILISLQHADVITFLETAEFLNIFLEKVGLTKVETEVLPLEEMITMDRQYKPIKAIVPSLRLDAVLSHGLLISRNAACADIRAGKVKINHLEVTDISKTLKEGDLISIRGYGRILFDCILGSTKKDRLILLLKKYI